MATEKQNAGGGWDIQNAEHTDCCALKNAVPWKWVALSGHWSQGGGPPSRC